jgi:hypothetical protein
MRYPGFCFELIALDREAGMNQPIVSLSPAGKIT